MSASAGSLPRYILQRVLLVIPMMWILMTMVFLLMRVAPGDPISAALGGKLTPQALAAARHQAGLDKPLIVQYWELPVVDAASQLREDLHRQPAGDRCRP